MSATPYQSARGMDKEIEYVFIHGYERLSYITIVYGFLLTFLKIVFVLGPT